MHKRGQKQRGENVQALEKDIFIVRDGENILCRPLKRIFEDIFIVRDGENIL